MVKKFLRDETGVTMVEYSLIAGLVSTVAITVLTVVGTFGVLPLINRVAGIVGSVAAP